MPRMPPPSMLRIVTSLPLAGGRIFFKEGDDNDDAIIIAIKRGIINVEAFKFKLMVLIWFQ